MDADLEMFYPSLYEYHNPKPQRGEISETWGIRLIPGMTVTPKCRRCDTLGIQMRLISPLATLGRDDIFNLVEMRAIPRSCAKSMQRCAENFLCLA